jgi:molybdate transport system regulatory protein
MITRGNESLIEDCPEQSENGCADVEEMKRHEPSIRLHLWLETGDGVVCGAGRAFLLQKIEECGSIRKAAEELGMSYRAAWGKIRKTEKVLGVQLIAQNGSKREGHRLTAAGRLLMEQYVHWFEEVEKEALKKARRIFPWVVKGFKEKAAGKILQCAIVMSLALDPFQPWLELGV